MTPPEPLIVALPLDHETDDILSAALELGQRLACPIVVVHALSERRLESDKGLAERIERARESLTPRLATLRAAGLVVEEVIACGSPAELVIETVQRCGAELIVMGGGRPATVRRWLVGSVAEAIVRRATVPVWVARGGPPIGEPILCPVDLSPQSSLGLTAAVRMARLFDAPLEVMTVLSANEEVTSEEARRAISAQLADQATEGLSVGVGVVKGEPADQIVDAAGGAGLLVVGSRGFDPLVPEWLGPVTTRALRHSPRNVLTVREVDIDLERRQSAVAKLADAHDAARALIADGRAADAFAMIESTAERAPINASIQETYAIVLEKVGRAVEARGRHEIAEMIRTRIGPR